MLEDERSFKVCTCIAKNHDHKPGECADPPTIRGGTCISCRLWFSKHLEEQRRIAEEEAHGEAMERWARV
jgi:hypothetical protein